MPKTTLQERMQWLVAHAAGGNVAAFVRLCEGVDRDAAPSETMLRNYLKKGAVPGIDRATVMAKAAGASVEWLATGEGEPQPGEKKSPPPRREAGRGAVVDEHLFDGTRDLQERDAEARSVPQRDVPGGERGADPVPEATSRALLRGLQLRIVDASLTLDVLVTGPDERAILDFITLVRGEREPDRG